MGKPKMGKCLIKNPFTSAGMVLGVILGLAITPGIASAQQASSSTNVPVSMVVTVKAHHGRQVPAVAKDDVKVYEHGKLDAVTSWIPLQGDRAGLQLYILIDDTSRDTLALQFNSMRKFIEEQPASTAIGVGYMRNGIVVTAQNLTTDHALAAKALRLPIGAAVGYTSPYLALTDLMKKWPVSGDRREVLMISSGVDPLGGGFSNNPYDNPYLDAALERAERGGFIIYSIYSPGAGFGGRGFLRTDFAQSGLDLISQKTGGEAYYLEFGSPVDLTPYLEDVSANLKHQYELTFLAKSVKKPTLQPVKVKSELPGTGLVTAADSYVQSGM